MSERVHIYHENGSGRLYPPVAVITADVQAGLNTQDVRAYVEQAIATHEISAPGTYLCIAVRDDGIYGVWRFDVAMSLTVKATTR